MAKKPTIKEPGRKDPLVPKKKDKESLIQDITNRYRVTAREARDIVTAVGTMGKAITPMKSQQAKGAVVSTAAKNLVQQVKETAKAAKTGAKGSPSDKLTKKTPKGWATSDWHGSVFGTEIDKLKNKKK